ncbi:hypothetical protein JTB14_038481 [Gonioctena quinquepunctata]|nr:hypothetical protein JTB14_038481 [Gonioctena quinquepunctata]
MKSTLRCTPVRKDALTQLGDKYNLGMNAVKAEIESLRSYFFKEHNKVMQKKTDSGADDIYESPCLRIRHFGFNNTSSEQRN